MALAVSSNTVKHQNRKLYLFFTCLPPTEAKDVGTITIVEGRASIRYSVGTVRIVIQNLRNYNPSEGATSPVRPRFTEGD